jgi:hypothetical protein
MADEKTVKGRTLVSFHHEGVNYKPDAVISVAPNVMKGLAASGSVDPHPDAVEYAEGLAAKAKAKADAAAEL